MTRSDLRFYNIWLLCVGNGWEAGTVHRWGGGGERAGDSRETGWDARKSDRLKEEKGKDSQGLP